MGKYDDYHNECVNSYRELFKEICHRFEKTPSVLSQRYYYVEIDSIELDGVKYDIVMEYDEGWPWEIYYGCKSQYVGVATNDQICDKWKNNWIEALVSKFSQNFWRNETYSRRRIRTFYGEPDCGSTGFFWPFWIRVEGVEGFDEVYQGVKLISEALSEAK